MTLIYSFLFCGFVCLIGQLILDNTKLTPGHVTSMFVVMGVLLGTFGIYDKFIDNFGAGASVLIASFGNTLFNFAFEGYEKFGCLGIFSNMLAGVSTGLVGAIVFSAILTIFFKVKD